MKYKDSNKDATPNTVRRTTDKPDALDTTPTSEPMADQPEKPEPEEREDERLNRLGDNVLKP